MTSLPMRDQVENHLLTPENSALLIIDFQPLQVASVASMDRGELVRNIVSLAKAAKLYGMPIVLSTVNMKTGVNQPTIHQLAEVLGEDRSVRPNHHQRLGRQGVPRCGQSNRPQKACNCRTVVGSVPHLPSPRCPREGYEVYPVVDAVGGTSVEAHRAALLRIAQAGARPTSWVQVGCELQRDWARQETAKEGYGIVSQVWGW